jgi:hypothetical protein
MNVEELKKYKENLYTSLCRDLSEFEKNFILVSTGVLAFTITFIKDIVKIDESSYLFLLLMSWILIIASIGLMMFTFLRSAKGSDDLSHTVDKFIVKYTLYDNATVLNGAQLAEIKTSIDKTFSGCKIVLRNSRYGSIWLFILGVSVLAAFVYLNLSGQSQKKSANQNQTPIIIKDTTILNSSKLHIIYEKSKTTDSIPR